VISRQLRGWAQHLQDSPIRGQRHLDNEDAPKSIRRRHDREEFLRELDEMRKKNEPARPSSSVD